MLPAKFGVKLHIIGNNSKTIINISNFEVNLIIRLGLIALFQYFFLFKHLCLIFQKLLEIKVKLKLQKCSACQDLHSLQF
jgi:hypothetical protein